MFNAVASCLDSTFRAQALVPLLSEVLTANGSQLHSLCEMPSVQWLSTGDNYVPRRYLVILGGILKGEAGEEESATEI